MFTIQNRGKSCNPSGFVPLLIDLLHASLDDSDDATLKAMILKAYEDGDIWSEQAERLIRPFGLRAA